MFFNNKIIFEIRIEFTKILSQNFKNVDLFMKFYFKLFPFTL
jgi:hypothetical protein